MKQPPKKALIDQLVAQLNGEIARIRSAALDAAQGATDEEAKPENDKDTRAIEASYLAAGQAERFRQLEISLKMLSNLELLKFSRKDPIRASAVVTLEDEDGVQTKFLVLPWFGGMVLELAGEKVQVVTPPSPLGAALLGRCQGEVIELSGKSGRRELKIADVW